MQIRTILEFSCANPQISRNVLHKPRPRVAVFSTLPSSGHFSSEGSFMSFLVCFRARYYCTLRSWASRNKETCLLSSRNSCTHTCNRERYVHSCLSYGKQCASLRRPNKGVEKGCVYARLPQGAKLADSARHTRFVWAILGLSCRARI